MRGSRAMDGEGHSQVSGMRARKAGRIYVAAASAAVFAALALSSFAFAADGTAATESESGASVATGSSAGPEPGALPFSQLDLALTVGGALVLLGAGAFTARLPSVRG